MKKQIIVGADPFGFDLKECVKAHLIQKGYNVTDVGTRTRSKPVDYYQVGYRVGKAIADKKFERGIVFCGTGMGVNIVANKFPGVYCGLCESVETARLCRSINDCNVLSLGGLFAAPYKALRMVDAFLSTRFTRGFPEADPEFLKCACREIGRIEAQIMNEYRAPRNARHSRKR
jgi:ribose 5-phosphate isomerase B